MKTIGLIGSCGYLGSIIYEKLKLNKNYNIVCYDRSNINVFPEHIQKSSKDITVDEINQCDIIIYLAGCCKKNICDTITYEELYKINVNELVNIVKNMNSNQLCIYASTAAIYSNNESIISSETDSINSKIFNNYELSMYEREIEVNKLNKNTIALRMGSVIGLSKNMKLDMLLNAIYYQAFLTKEINIWNPKSYRAILWREDLTNIIEVIIEYKNLFNKGEIFNLSSFNTTVYNSAKYVADNLNINCNIINDFNNIGFQMDCSKLYKLFNYTPIGANYTIYNEFTRNKTKFLEIVNNTIKINNKKCILCKNSLTSIVDLGNQPLANNLQEKRRDNIEKYPLELFRCKNCFHTQLGHFINREVLFKKYLYESGVSQTSKEYFSNFAENYTNKFSNKKNKNILEIACNDGSQLDEFYKKGWKTYGVDPAENIVVKAIEKNHNVKCAFWGNTTNNVKFYSIDFDLIVAQNVFAHVTNPIDFLQNCIEIMNNNTLLVIQTSQANMYENGEFDTIYHEHISFFTIQSMKKLVENVGCSLINVYKTSIHGVSYVFEIKKGKYSVDLELLNEEIKKDLYEDSKYINYSLSVKNKKCQALEFLKKYKNNNYNIIGYGAAAKGIVFLNYIFDSNPSALMPEYIIDESLLKIDLFTPSTNIEIKSIDIINKYTNKLFIIILAWNFYEEIIYKIKKFKLLNNINIIIETVCFFPKIKIDIL